MSLRIRLVYLMNSPSFSFKKKGVVLMKACQLWTAPRLFNARLITPPPPKKNLYIYMLCYFIEKMIFCTGYLIISVCRCINFRLMVGELGADRGKRIGWMGGAQ